MDNLIPRVKAQDLNQKLFIELIEDKGFVIVEEVISEELCYRLREDLTKAIKTEDAWHGTDNRKDHAMLIACPIYGGAFLDLLEVDCLISPFDWTLGDTSIIYAYVSSSMPPFSTNYSNRIHVDRPHFIPGFMEAFGCLVMVDDFTEENGATWVLPGSHKLPEEPDKEYFYKNAVRATGKKGSVIYFHLRLWHAGGDNHTSEWRHCVGIGFIRGYMKQRIDLPRALENNGVNVSHLSKKAIQKLGYLSQPPASLEEYYGKGILKTFTQRSEWEK